MSSLWIFILVVVAIVVVCVVYYFYQNPDKWQNFPGFQQQMKNMADIENGEVDENYYNYRKYPRGSSIVGNSSKMN